MFTELSGPGILGALGGRRHGGQSTKSGVPNNLESDPSLLCGLWQAERLL